jgi:hypothetical protein
VRSRTQEKFERILIGIAFLVLLIGVVLPWAREAVVPPASTDDTTLVTERKLTDRQREELRSLADDFQLTDEQRAVAREWVREYEATGKTPDSLDDAASQLKMTDGQRDQAYKLVKQAGE